jgi:hypothetical protein
MLGTSCCGGADDTAVFASVGLRELRAAYQALRELGSGCQILFPDKKALRSIADLLAGDGVQEIYEIDDALTESRVYGFATPFAPDRDHPAMSTIYNEITKLGQLNAARRLESINRKGLIGLLLA